MAIKPDLVDKASLVDEPHSLLPAASLFHSLSDPARLALLQHLALGEHRVVDLQEHLGLAQSTVSTHLACLRDCGLVTSRPQGQASMFSLAADRGDFAFFHDKHGEGASSPQQFVEDIRKGCELQKTGVNIRARRELVYLAD